MEKQSCEEGSMASIYEAMEAEKTEADAAWEAQDRMDDWASDVCIE